MNIISIAISTISNRIEELDLKPYDGVQYVIVHQDAWKASEQFLTAIKNRPDIVYIPLERKGLSVSRNIALFNSTSEYIMIMDDDVSFSIDAIYKVLEKMIIDKVDVATYYHKYTDGKSTLRNKNSYVHNNFNIANPSSIDICVKKDSILNKNIKFDELFGLGSLYPSGEEMIFLSDCLKNDLLVKRYPFEICVHPPVTSGVDFYSTQQKVNAKKAMLKRVYDKYGTLAFILFSVKKVPVAYKAGFGISFIKKVILALRDKNV